MKISYNEDSRVFKLDTERTSYCIGIVDDDNFVGHIYYGRKLTEDNLAYLMRTGEPPFVPSENNRERTSFLDTFPMEYTGHNLGDYREAKRRNYRQCGAKSYGDKSKGQNSKNCRNRLSFAPRFLGQRLWKRSG